MRQFGGYPSIHSPTPGATRLFGIGGMDGGPSAESAAPRRSEAPPPPTFEPRDLSVLLLIRSENKLLMLRAAILAIAAHSRCDVTAAGVRILGSADVAQINLWKMLAKRMHYYHVFHRCTIPLGISA